MRSILELYDVHTAFALANNVHLIGFALNYRLALRPPTPTPTPIPMSIPILPLIMAPTLVEYPISRAQRPNDNGRALNSNQDLRLLRLLSQLSPSM
jgi:hypothetical protein